MLHREERWCRNVQVQSGGQVLEAGLARNKTINHKLYFTLQVNDSFVYGWDRGPGQSFDVCETSVSNKQEADCFNAFWPCWLEHSYGLEMNGLDEDVELQTGAWFGGRC